MIWYGLPRYCSLLGNPIFSTFPTFSISCLATEKTDPYYFHILFFLFVFWNLAQRFCCCGEWIDLYQRSSLTFGETLCAVFIPLIGIAEALFFSLAGCFDLHRNKHDNKKNQIPTSFDDIVRLAEDSPCSFLLFCCFILFAWFCSRNAILIYLFIYFFNLKWSFFVIVASQLRLMKLRRCVSCSRSWVVPSLMTASFTR